MKRMHLFLIAVMMVAMLAGCGSKEGSQPDSTQSPPAGIQGEQLSQNEQLFLQIQENTPLPEIPVVDKEGGETVLRAQEGEILVINLWASWCGYCIKEIPYFNEVHERLAGEGVRIVAVNVLDSAGDPYTQAEVQAAFSEEERLGVAFPGYVDYKNEAAIQFAVRSVPMTIFVDGSNNIVLRYPGMFQSAQELEEWLGYVQKYAGQ